MYLLAATRLVFAILSVVVALHAQQQVEHVGPAEAPSRALFKLVKQGNEELLWFDVGYAIRSVVVCMHEDWGWIEGKRATGLSNLLDAMRERLAEDPSDDEAKRMIAVADVADALLGYPERDGELQRAELLEVRAVGDGRMRFLGKRPTNSRALDGITV